MFSDASIEILIIIRVTPLLLRNFCEGENKPATNPLKTNKNKKPNPKQTKKPTQKKTSYAKTYLSGVTSFFCTYTLNTVYGVLSKNRALSAK